MLNCFSFLTFYPYLAQVLLSSFLACVKLGILLNANSKSHKTLLVTLNFNFENRIFLCKTKP